MEQEKDVKNIAKFHNKIVEKRLIKFEKKLTLNQHKLLYYVLINEKNGTELQGMPWKELQEIIGTTKNLSLNEKKQFVKEMTSIKLFIELDEENMESIVIFPNFGIRYNKIHYSINNSVKELFEQPTVNYYLMNYDWIKNFKHDYSILIYQLLNKELSANETKIKNFVYDIAKLKEYLGLEIDKYYDPKNFRIRVLEPSLREISEHSDINIAGGYNTNTKKTQLSSKVWGKEKVIISGISRKATTQEYMDEKRAEYAEQQDQGRTKIIKAKTKAETNSLEPIVYNDETGSVPSEQPTQKEIINGESIEGIKELELQLYKKGYDSETVASIIEITKSALVTASEEAKTVLESSKPIHLEEDDLPFK